MIFHITLKEKDVFPDKKSISEDIVFEDRPTGKAVVFDSDRNIALVGNEVNDYYLLPGGGIDLDEPVTDGIIRECLEEIGCDVKLLDNLGITEDFRNRDKKHCINYCYSAEVVGEKGKLQLTDEEEKNGMHVKWVSLEEALQILEKEKDQVSRGKVGFYNTAFNILRDHIFLIEAQKIIRK